MIKCYDCGDEFKGGSILEIFGGDTIHFCTACANAALYNRAAELQEERQEESEPDESMDGDHESALASAGWGTDEDYGYFGGDE